MSDFTIQYALNAMAWFIGGVVASSLWWRFYFHRRMLKTGAAQKESPLNSFIAVVVVLMVAAGYLFTTSASIRLTKYTHCQADVNQTNVNTINDRSKSTIAQVKGEVHFYHTLVAQLSAPPNRGETITSEVILSLATEIRLDMVRLNQIQHDPLQPITSCKSPTDAKG